MTDVAVVIFAVAQVIGTVCLRFCGFLGDIVRFINLLIPHNFNLLNYI